MQYKAKIKVEKALEPDITGTIVGRIIKALNNGYKVIGEFYEEPDIDKRIVAIERDGYYEWENDEDIEDKESYRITVVDEHAVGDDVIYGTDDWYFSYFPKTDTLVFNRSYYNDDNDECNDIEDITIMEG